eukprot:COSAG05_NODE_676_length_7987_cov_3.066041_3_plen_72_part_00
MADNISAAAILARRIPDTCTVPPEAMQGCPLAACMRAGCWLAAAAMRLVSLATGLKGGGGLCGCSLASSAL